jgi:hypothetical protein
MSNSRFFQNWTMKGSCSLVQSQGVSISAAIGADYGGEKFLEDCALENPQQTLNALSAQIPPA